MTYPGLPAPVVCDFWERDSNHGFHIAHLNMVVNSGTYIDAPFHRSADGDDIAQLTLARTAALPGRCIRIDHGIREIGLSLFDDIQLQDQVVLLHTGWDRHWQTDDYAAPNPYLAAAVAQYLRDAGVALVGIDRINIDDRTRESRPVHEILLRAGIPIVEHLTGMEQLPDTGFRFFAMPARVRGVGSFPVGACAEFA